MRRKIQLDLSMREFFAVWPLSAVALFTLNNWYLKMAYGNWLTGKLSDVTACFFLPLYLSAIFSLVGWRSRKHRLVTSSWIVAIIFTSVKLFEPASQLLNHIVSPLFIGMTGYSSINRVDPSDLIALPFIYLAFWYGKKRLAI